MTTPIRVVEDPDVPALSLLTGPDYRALLDALLEETGGSVRSARVGQVRYVPGKSVSVQYEADVQAGGETTRRTFVAVSAPDAPPDVPQLTADGITVSVWAYPFDPYLPGLASATDPDRVSELLNDLGAPTDQVRLRRRAYRAGRRAVIEARGSSASIYLKVLRPTRVAALQSLHTAMAAALPVPHSLGSAEALGLVALQALPGRPLRRAIEAGSTRLPSPASLVRLLDSIPSVRQAAAPGPIARTADHSRLISKTMPEVRERVEGIAASVSVAPTEDEVPIHGDFHASQILVDGSQITGLVDVDTAGMGSRSDDFAGLLAQLSTLALSSPQRGRLDAYGAALIAAFDRLVDPVGLRLRVAAAVLGFATGPFRVQMKRWPDETMARLRLAEQWAESSRGVR